MYCEFHVRLFGLVVINISSASRQDFRGKPFEPILQQCSLEVSDLVCLLPSDVFIVGVGLMRGLAV
jgi:hypothetical protein